MEVTTSWHVAILWFLVLVYPSKMILRVYGKLNNRLSGIQIIMLIYVDYNIDFIEIPLQTTAHNMFKIFGQ